MDAHVSSFNLPEACVHLYAMHLYPVQNAVSGSVSFLSSSLLLCTPHSLSGEFALYVYVPALNAEMVMHINMEPATADDIQSNKQTLCTTRSVRLH